jgi:hypothetical protein
MKEPEKIEQPQSERNDHNAVENRLDVSLQNGNEAIHELEKDTHHNENFPDLN